MRAARLFSALSWLLLCPAIARAATEEGGSHFFWEVFNLLLMLSVLAYLARKPVLNYLSERRATVEKNLASSEQLLREAEGRLAEWTQRADGLEGEVEEIRRRAEQRAEEERTRILEAAQASAERLRRDAEAAVERELRRAREILRAEAAELAIELAGERLRAAVDEGDRDRLVDEFVARIDRSGTGVARGSR